MPYAVRTYKDVTFTIISTHPSVIPRTSRLISADGMDVLSAPALINPDSLGTRLHTSVK